MKNRAAAGAVEPNSSSHGQMGESAVFAEREAFEKRSRSKTRIVTRRRLGYSTHYCMGQSMELEEAFGVRSASLLSYALEPAFGTCHDCPWSESGSDRLTSATTPGVHVHACNDPESLNGR
jgi:hypothetical protein